MSAPVIETSKALDPKSSLRTSRRKLRRLLSWLTCGSKAYTVGPSFFEMGTADLTGLLSQSLHAPQCAEFSLPSCAELKNEFDHHFVASFWCALSSVDSSERDSLDARRTRERVPFHFFDARTTRERVRRKRPIEPEANTYRSMRYQPAVAGPNCASLIRCLR